MRSDRNHIDITILISVLVLMVFSLAVVYSASSTFALEKFGSSDKLLESHVAKVLMGFLAILIFMNINYSVYKKVSKVILLSAVLLLVITLGLGGEIKGATRWLHLGGFSLQPSEFAKYALIVHVCVLFATKKERVRDFKQGFVPLMIWIALVTGLVLVQPNFSNGAMIFLISLVLLFIGRAKLSHIAVTFAVLMPILVVVMLTAQYRVQRIMNFVGGGHSGNKSNYQLWQGIIGFGNGGLFGLGPGESRQRDFFLPESYGDFVFSIVGEEYGLIGTLVIMLLFFLIMVRGMKIAKYARDDFGRYLAVGIVASISLYALINAGVTLGILPTTGLPMPFVSYGGSSMLFSSVAIGILLNISSHTDLHPRMAKPNTIKEASTEPVLGKVY